MNTPSSRPFTGPIAWMAQNSVAANLVMILFVVGGLIFASRTKREVYPELQLDVVEVSVNYPGAGPEEVEEGIVLAIEDEVRSLEGIKKVASTSFEGKGVVMAELLTGENSNKILQDVKNSVDSILSFPEEAERPIVRLFDLRRRVISLMIYGDLDKHTLYRLAEKIRDEVSHIPGITLVEIESAPNLEINIEVPQRELRAYNLKLGEIADIVRRTALDLPGGGVKSPTGEVLLRTRERREYAGEFEDIPIVTNPDGTEVALREIATVRENFEETDEEATFNGKPAIRLDVYRIGGQDPLVISDKVKGYVRNLRISLPSTVKVEAWDDHAEIYEDRINLLLKNALIGLMLVLILLGLFLEPMLAFWVTLGIPISIVGSFLIFPWLGISINMVSLFAFIITLGIIVDDAILVGENVFQKRELGMPYREAAIVGTREICVPVTFSVLTNMAAFTPLLFVPGNVGKLFFQIPVIVISVFAISLIESLFVLPAHLTHRYNDHRVWKWLNIPRKAVEKQLAYFIHHPFLSVLKTVMASRYLVFTISIGIIVFVISLIIGGHVPFSFLPRFDIEVITARVNLPFGVPIETSRKVQQLLVDGAGQILREEGEEISRGIYTQIGRPFFRTGPITRPSGETGSHLVGTQVFLVPSDQRKINGIEFANRWRELVGEIPLAESVNFEGSLAAFEGSAIDIQLSHPSTEVLKQAGKELAEEIKTYQGIVDVDEGTSPGKPQLSFRLKPKARALQITSRDLAEQVRGAFYGAEAFRQQRDRNEMKVLVRLPEEERKQIKTIEDLVIRVPGGGEIPISEAAEVFSERAYTSMMRTDGRRTQSVTADVDEEIANSNQLINAIEKAAMPGLLKKYPGLSYTVEGAQQEQEESLEAMNIGFIFALFLIYAMLAIAFTSYLQPVIVMLSIPFGVIGAIIGHLLLGFEMSISSLMGIVALSGVVVNDSLLFVVTANRMKEENMPTADAVIGAGLRRFRPILLTSLTTFFGLSPMIFETSMQARFLIPMSISLGFGILFSPLIIMFITTSVYLILDDIKKFFVALR
ncbi:MAG: efflux RND transporter permease subunit [Waddliaceae bacterium]